MWERIADGIIRLRVYLFAGITLVTLVMGYFATKVQMSYDLPRTVPLDDPDMVFYQNFKDQFGEDGNMIAIALKDSSLYELKNFQRFRQLSNEIRSIEGIQEALSLPLAKIALKDTLNKRFVPTSLFPENIATQAELDSLLQLANAQVFQINQLSNTKNGATRLIAPMRKDYANSAKRIGVVDKLKAYGDAFTKDTGIQLHYAGLPFVRTVMATQVKAELSMFLYLSAIVTGLIMLLFFKSVRAVIFSMIMIGVMVVWVMGTITLLGYKISLLSGLIPPVIVTIGITNAIYLLNKYHLEFVKRKNKTEAIRAVVLKMGLATFLTNLTVAIGFLTLLSTDIMVLREFGIVAGLNIIALFVVTLVMIPGMLSWMPEPSSKHLRHLDFKLLGGFVKLVDLLVHRHRAYIYIATLAITVISVIGISKLYSVSYMVDDIPEDSPLKRDLKFLEENFSGFMPLEMVVDINARRKKPLQDLKIMQAIDRFEGSLDSITVTSTPISVVSLVKTAKQAYHNNNPNRYQLPSSMTDAAFVLQYMKGQSDSSGLFKSFIDSSYTKMRISMQMADIGSHKMDSLINQIIQPKTDHLVTELKKNLKGPTDSVRVSITGSSKIFIKGSKFLIDNLTESLILACILITLSMALLFANWRMILISLIPNVIALMITAGLMGYFNIPLKASTALIFSITFGISVDNSIRFLAKYRQELLSTGFFVPRSVSESILETGKSIVYTSIVLFAGFIIFAFSDFGGTVALGLLTSTTLIISMFTNLILLPALIMTFDKPKRKVDRQLIDDIDPNFYGEAEDVAIDITKIRIHDRKGSAE
ncbi:MAG TPA: efflux RND transporter permease subunit [Cyclobacteriaceae bacterium]|nr:efflux RND transporter permease subunit [Cyclobacteriaceae bacterium]